MREPAATTDHEIARLRDAGPGAREIFEATTFLALRLAFSTINDALGAAPDKQLADAASALVQAAVAFGRALSREPSRA